MCLVLLLYLFYAMILWLRWVGILSLLSTLHPSSDQPPTNQPPVLSCELPMVHFYTLLSVSFMDHDLIFVPRKVKLVVWRM